MNIAARDIQSVINTSNSCCCIEEKCLCTYHVELEQIIHVHCARNLRQTINNNVRIVRRQKPHFILVGRSCDVRKHCFSGISIA